MESNMQVQTDPGEEKIPADDAISKDPLPIKTTRLTLTTGCVVAFVWLALLFFLSRSLGTTLGNTYLTLFFVHLVINTACILIMNPLLMPRRMKSPLGKNWDIAIVFGFMVSIIAMVILARQDLKLHLTTPVPLDTLWLFGLGVFVFGWIILTWSMVANPFFEKNVRIQTENNHHVIDGGPYAYVRHPGYIGVFFSINFHPCTPGFDCNVRTRNSRRSCPRDTNHPGRPYTPGGTPGLRRVRQTNSLPPRPWPVVEVQ